MNVTEYHDLKKLAERALHVVSCTEQSFANDDAERYRIGIRRAAIFILSGDDQTGGWLRRPQG